MGSNFSVLLVDDGELSDIRDLLLELGVDFAHLRGGAVPDRVDPPSDLFVTTGRRAALARSWAAPTGDGPVRIAVVDEDSNALRSALRRMGFAFLVRRPVHRVALRLLLLRALYRGEERRTEPRVAIGCEVAIGYRGRRRDAILADVSRQACRLLADEPLPERARVTIHVPEADRPDAEVALPGKVVRSDLDADEDAYSVVVRFGKLGEEAQRLVGEALSSHVIEPADEEPVAADAAPEERVEPEGVTGPVQTDSGTLIPGGEAPRPPGRKDRRRTQRGRFGTRVIASIEQTGHRVLIGRDLSTSGMRIDRHPDLRTGTGLRIAVYDAGREQPLVMDARVARDDGEMGHVLRFEGISDDLAQRLEQLVSKLPPVECLLDGESAALGTVVGEILP